MESDGIEVLHHFLKRWTNEKPYLSNGDLILKCDFTVISLQ